jgi:aminopeptidase YwaD
VRPAFLAAVWAAAALAAPPADRPPHELVDQARLMAELAALPTQRAARGDLAHQRGLAQTERHLADRLRGLGQEPRLFPLSWNLQREHAARHGSGPPGTAPPEPDGEFADRTWNNLIVELPGRGGPDLAREVLIVSCHFDAASGAPGADDNGTGTAALLELARILRDRPMLRTVRLAFFNLEEIGLKGSAEYARSLRPRLDSGEERLIGMISLEMLGYFTDEPNSQRSPIPPIEGVFDPPTVGDFIVVATTRRHAAFAKRLEAEMTRAEPGLKTVTPDFLPDWPLCPPDLLRSDHAPFMMMGYPAVMVTDTSNFRNPHYHKPSDTIETIDPRRYTQVVRAIVAAVYAIAGPAEVPAGPETGPPTDP